MPFLTMAVLLLQLPRGDEWTATKPDALIAAEQARQRIYKADLNLLVQKPGLPDPVIERVIISNDQFMQFVDGTADGVTYRDEKGKLVKGRKSRAFVRPGERWRFWEDATEASVYEGQNNIYGKGVRTADYRSLGMYFLKRTRLRALEEALSDEWNLAGVYKQEQTADGLWKVTHKAAMDDSESLTTWYIDPEKDWNIIRCEHHVDGRLKARVANAYQQYDGIWFPQASRYTAGGGRPVYTVTVTSAKLNSPDTPDKLSLEMLGLVPGVTINRTNEQGGRTRMVWLGEGKPLVTPMEHARLLGTGELKPDPRLTARMEKLLRELPDVSPAELRLGKLSGVHGGGLKDLCPWENYVRNFIHRYKLDDDQKEKAWKVMRRCEEQRQQYLKRIKPRLTKLREEAVKTDDKRFEQIKDEVRKLYVPVKEIFEKQLKPGLMKIPTRTQIKAADENEPKKKKEP